MTYRTKPSQIAFTTMLCAASITPFGAARANVVISTGQTQNMSCSDGTCVPTASDATLNLMDLENLLASGSLDVSTTGAGVQANDIVINAPLSWSSANTLSLNAYRSITISKTVSVAGQGGLSLATNDGGTGGALSFGPKGHADFQNTSSQLFINGTAYTLVDSIQSLAGAVAANSGGAFALANNYDAEIDGTYAAAPVQTGFTGTFEGLGNGISHLSIKGSGYIGLFQAAYANIENLALRDIKFTVVGSSIVGGLAGEVGTVSHVAVTGSIKARGSAGSRIGGLAGGGGPLTDCSTDVQVVEDEPSTLGGLVGLSAGIDRSSATGSLSASGNGSTLGGLAGINAGDIQNSYSTVAVTGGSHSIVGGLVGTNGGKDEPGTVESSYSTGEVSGGPRSKVGGFGGMAKGSSQFEQSYWDTETSGTNEPLGKGKGNGITALTTEQLQSGLPGGFDPAIWAQNKKINNGFPYLIDNPPPGKK